MDHRQPSTRREILTSLKKRGEMTVAQLSDMIGITPMGIRQHLAILQRDNLIVSRNVRQKVGRPTQVYSLTPVAEEFFPASYSNLALNLLAHLKVLDGPDKITHLFERRLAELEQTYRARTEGKALKDKVKELARIRDEEGYMADWEQVAEGEFTLTEHHCPISSVAQHHPDACRCELELFACILQVEVVREHHLMAGDVHCRYRIRAGEDEKAAGRQGTWKTVNRQSSTVNRSLPE